MSEKQNETSQQATERVFHFFEQAKEDPALLKKIGEDPLGTLQNMGVSVEEQFKQPVRLQLQAVIDDSVHQATVEEVERMSAEARKIEPAAQAPAPPTGLRIVEEKVPPAVPLAMEFVFRPWGVVLVVREPAVNYLQGGGTISAGVLSGIGGIAAALGPFGVLIGVIIGICAAALTIYAGIIQLTDKGKGVYLTWTWAQLIPGLPQYGLPVVTAI